MMKLWDGHQGDGYHGVMKLHGLPSEVRTPMTTHKLFCGHQGCFVHSESRVRWVMTVLHSNEDHKVLAYAPV